MTKSKYILHANYNRTPKASYVTTQRNAEDMINEMLKMYDNPAFEYLHIYRETDGERHLVYSKKPRRKKKIC